MTALNPSRDELQDRLLQGLADFPHPRLLEALALSSCWLVGGFVRDLALGRTCQDVDVVLPKGAERLCQALRRKFGGAIVPLDTERNIYRLAITAELHVDVAEFQGPDLRADLGARDFSINAMAMLPMAEEAALIDPLGGLADLAERRLRVVSAQSLHSDPLRILRAARLGAQLDLTLEEGTRRAMLEAAHELKRIALERIHAELEKLLALEHGLEWLRLLEQVGAFRGFVPHARPGLGLPLLGKVWHSTGPHPEALRWAALTLDWQGLELTPRQTLDLLSFLRVPARMAQMASTIASGPGLIQKASSEEELTRVLLRLDSAARPAIALAEALALGCAEEARRFYLQKFQPSEGSPAWINGKDLLAAGFKPGPQIGQLIENIEIKRKLGTLATRDEALAWVQSQRPGGSE